MATSSNCKVKKVIYHDSKDLYTVAVMERDKEKEFIAIFYDSCMEGEKVTLKGDWINHKKYGKQFKANIVEKNLDEMSNDEILVYIQNIKGIGPARAEKIVDKFGENTIEVMQKKPEKLKLANIPDSVIENVKEEFKEDELFLSLKQKLLPLGLTMNMIRKIYKQYNDKALGLLKKNPYQLADDIHGVGFKKADEIAMKLGIDPESDFRIKSCLKYILQQKASLGHVYLPMLELIKEVREELQQFIPAKRIQKNIVEHEDLVEEKGNVYLKYLYYYELEIANKLHNLAEKKGVKKVKDSIDKLISDVEKQIGFCYTKQQKKAIKNTFLNSVSIITGGPGTGKTTIVKAILDVAEKNNFNVALAAPTGKAAKRMEETTGKEAKTIHRLLEFKPFNDDGSWAMTFERNKFNPLEEDLIIIDEASMLDTVLMYYLIDAVDSRIVFIGDIAQLPSIGPGTVLSDMIKNLPTTRLDAIFRQKGTSSIIVNSQKINSGNFPYFNNKDFLFYEYTSPEQIVDVFLNELEKNDIKELQILTPMRKTDAGTIMLNKLVQDCINPKRFDDREISIGEKVFRVNDKVMQLRNNYEKECFNGDVGVIKSIYKMKDEINVVVKFDDREISFTEDEVKKDMDLAYAMTIHKSQGSQFQTVIVPVITSHFIMLKRNLIYTAVTRAKNKVVIVGQKKAIGMAVKTVDATKRYTSLSKRIREV